MAANVAVAQDPAGNLKPAKDKSTDRIDGIVAAIMAIGRAMVAQEEPQPEYTLFFSEWRTIVLAGTAGEAAEKVRCYRGGETPVGTAW